MVDVVALFCKVDDFCKKLQRLTQGKALGCCKKRGSSPMLATSEIITIVILFHCRRFRNFKIFYQDMLTPYWKSFFPRMPSYNHFVAIKKSIVIPLYCYLNSQFGKCSGISFVDSTSLSVCHPRRINSHKVFKKMAKRGKTSVGWFYGFKLHIIVNDEGELLAIMLTPGNVDDRQPVMHLVKQGKIFEILVGDKGYISSLLFKTLLKQGTRLLTKLRKNMKNYLISTWDKCLLRKRCIIETIIDQLKNISQIEHSRHRSPVNFLVNLFAGLAAYTHRSKKPSLNMRYENGKQLMIS